MEEIPVKRGSEATRQRAARAEGELLLGSDMSKLTSQEPAGKKLKSNVRD